MCELESEPKISVFEFETELVVYDPEIDVSETELVVYEIELSSPSLRLSWLCMRLSLSSLSLRLSWWILASKLVMTNFFALTTFNM